MNRPALGLNVSRKHFSFAVNPSRKTALLQVGEVSIASRYTSLGVFCAQKNLARERQAGRLALTKAFEVYAIIYTLGGE